MNVPMSHEIRGPIGYEDKIVHAYGCFNMNTEMGYKVGPRLCESRLQTPSGRGARVHATQGLSYSPALYSEQIQQVTKSREL